LGSWHTTDVLYLLINESIITEKAGFASKFAKPACDIIESG
jgi:hypothetical protein